MSDPAAIRHHLRCVLSAHGANVTEAADRFRVLMVTVQEDVDGTYEVRSMINGREVASSKGWTTRLAAFDHGAKAAVLSDDVLNSSVA